MNRREFVARTGTGLICASAPLPGLGREAGSGQRFSLIDARRVGHSHFLTRQVAQPQRVSVDPVIAPAGAAGTILRADDGGFRMWYSTVRSIKVKGMAAHQSWIHLATTKDGIHFEKPDLGIHEGNVLIKGNSVGADGRPLTGNRGCSGFCVLDARQQKVPHARSRYTAMYRSWVPGRHGGLSLAHSEDGLRWTEYPENPVKILQSDTFNNFFYDARIEKYVAYVRPWIHAGHRHVNRSVARLTSDDMIRWTEERIVLDTDDRDAPAVGAVNEAKLPDGTRYPRGRNKQFYGLTVKPHGDIQLGFASLYDVEPGTMSIELVHSYDGIDWRREATRPALISSGGQDAWDSAVVYYPVVGSPLEIGDDWFIYYHGINMDHHLRIRSRKDLGEFRAMGAVKLKRDRLVGYTAKGAMGELMSAPFEFKAAPLSLNINAKAGIAKVAVCRENGNLIKGYTFADAEPINRDGVSIKVRFRGKSIEELTGQRIRLRVRLTDASVYGWETG